MDLNYLFHRQQVERSRAKAAASEEAQIAHEQLARCYEVQIQQATGDEFRIAPEAKPKSASSGTG
jgi:hypothetical protein